MPAIKLFAAIATSSVERVPLAGSAKRCRAEGAMPAERVYNRREPRPKREGLSRIGARQRC